MGNGVYVGPVVDAFIAQFVIHAIVTTGPALCVTVFNPPVAAATAFDLNC
jgi:hypothetical protein